jgi:hypothetical protein
LGISNFFEIDFLFSVESLLDISFDFGFLEISEPEVIFPDNFEIDFLLSVKQLLFDPSFLEISEEITFSDEFFEIDFMFSVKHSLDITFDSGVLEISEPDIIFSEDFLLPILLVLLPDDLTTPSSFFNLTLSLVVGFILLLEVLISRTPALVSGNFI